MISLSGYTCNDSDEVFKSEKQIQDFLKAFDAYLIRVIDKSKTIEGIDQLALSEEGWQLLPTNHRFTKNRIDIEDTFAKCNIAGVAGNPRLKEIVMQQWELYSDPEKDWHQKTRKQLMDLLRYFKDPAVFEEERITKHT